jgi:hypothetical protein
VYQKIRSDIISNVVHYPYTDKIALILISDVFLRIISALLHSNGSIIRNCVGFDTLSDVLRDSLLVVSLII